MRHSDNDALQAIDDCCERIKETAKDAAKLQAMRRSARNEPQEIGTPDILGYAVDGVRLALSRGVADLRNIVNRSSLPRDFDA